MWKYCSTQIQKSLHKSNKNAETKNKTSDETNNYQQTVEKNRSHHLCIICKQTFESESDLEKHFPTCGSQNTRNISKKVDKLKSQDCMIDTSIQDSCVGTKMLRSNEQSQVKTDKLNCEVCHKSFHSAENLTIHVNTCKKINLPCERCGTKWKSWKQCQNHLRQCHDKLFKYDMCAKVFKRKDTLLYHINVHYLNRDGYSCPLCSTEFLTEKFLQSHTIKEHISTV